MAFPTTSVLDAFTGADEDPIATNWSGPTRPTGGQLRRVSNQLARQVAAGTSYHSYYDISTFDADCEAWMTVATVPTAGGCSVTARIVNPNAATVHYYQFTFTAGTGWRMFVVTNNGYTQIGSTVASPAMANGDSIGIECVGSSIRGHHKTGGSWSQIMAVTNSTIATGGYIGVELHDDSAQRADDFGGGNIVTGVTTRTRSLLGVGT